MRLSLVLSFVFLSVIVITPTVASAAINPGTCTVLNRTLTVGSYGSDVSDLQRFLVAQNYPGGGAWMVTGYYGLATQVAVRNFQVSAGLSQTGHVDTATRSAIQQYSCGGTSYYSNPYSTNYYGQGIVLGASTTYYYDPYANQYPYNSCTYYNCQNQSISISYLSPTSGSAGTYVTINGTGFTEENNTVHFGTGIVPFIRSYNGTSLSFEVPDTISGYGSQPLYNQTYTVYVTNAYGQNSNQLQFSVTNTGYNYSTGYGNNPTLSNVTGPTSVAVNTSGTWQVTVHGPQDSIAKVDVIWGDEYQSGSSGSAQQSVFLGTSGSATLSFSHTYQTIGTYAPSFITANSYGSHSLSKSILVY